MTSSVPLDVAIRDLLGARKGEWQSIASEAGISYSWLSKFFNGHIDNPGYRTLCGLHDVLTRPSPAELAQKLTDTAPLAQGGGGA